MTSRLVLKTLARQQDVNNGRAHDSLDKTLSNVINNKLYSYIRRHWMITKIVLFKIISLISTNVITSRKYSFKVERAPKFFFEFPHEIFHTYNRAYA